MAATRFSALYCSQLYRNKKVKNWLDGYVEVNGSKITLLDERNEVVESLYRTGRRLGEGDDVEFDKWYCTVEGALQNVGGTAPVAKKMSQSTPRYDTPRTPLPAPQSTSVRKKFSLTVTPRAPTPIQASSTQDDEAPMPSPLPKSISHRVSEPLREIEQPHETIRARANAQPQSQLQLQTPSKPATPVNPRAPRSSDELLQLFGMSDEEDDELDAPVPIVFDAAATAVMQDGVPLASASPRLNGTKRPADVGTSLVSEGGEDLVVSKRRRIVPSVDAVSEPPKSASTIPAVNQPAGTPSKPRPLPHLLHNIVDCLKFPGPQDCQKLKPEKIQRTTRIPASFKTVNAYKESFLRALTENLQIQLRTSAINYHAALREAKNKNKKIDNLTEYLRAKGLPYYERCQLTWYNAPYQTGNKKRPKNLLLAFENKEHYSVYSKDDLWAISGDPDFTTTFIGRSQFYGASRNSVMEIIPMSPHDTTLANTLLTTTHTAWALRVASASSDILMMDNLRDNLGRTGLLTTVLDPSAGGGGAGGTGGTGTAKAKAKGRGFKAPSSAALVDGEKLEDYWRVMADVAGSYGLNESQREVLTQFASSIAVPGTPPICLAHGVFGAGKSFLVSVIVIFLHKAMASGCLRKPDKFKVLVASMTNVAVDRILLELLRLEFRDFVRVGSLKKIAKPVLPFTAQAKNDHEDTRDLQDLLNGELTPEERRDVEETMAKFKKNMNKSITEKAFLVGATCLATTFESFDWYQNTVVILDECSQMTEPMSLLPLARFGSQKALLVGDPLQLPPTIPTTADPSRKDGLERTLFERLAESGLTPVLLRTQYRCHPAIAQISNELFYQGQLTHGKTAQELCPLYNGLPTLSFVDVPKGQEAQQKGGTWANFEEAHLIVTATRKLLDIGVDANEIGVIALYRGQAEVIQTMLRGEMATKKKGGVQVSTVDAFQGAEKTVILLSTVRTRYVGFIDEPRRVNVALTRAKRHLFIFGNKTLLSRDKLWGKVLAHSCTESGETGTLHPAGFITLLDRIAADVAAADAMA